MLDFLFNGTEMVNAWTKLLISVGIIGIIALILWILFKTKTFAPFMKIFSKVMAVVLFVALVFSGVYSYLYVNAYHKEQGGIYGRLSKIVYNSIESAKGENENITYNFKSLVFKQDEDGKYSITFIQEYKDEDHRTRFQNGEKYSIFVHNNGTDYECNYIQYEIDWIVAEYSYVFYNAHDETDVIGDDTLSFDFCFYENYSYLKITSSADYTTIQLWDAYFQKYDFQVSIKVVDEVYEPIEFQKNVIDGYVQISQIIEETGESRKMLVPVSDSDFWLSSDIVYGDYYILGWKDENGESITKVSLRNSANVKIYADAVDLTEMLEVNFYNHDGSTIIETRYYQYGDEIDFEVTAKQIGLVTSGRLYYFKGWDTIIRNPYQEVTSYNPTYVTTITKSTNLYPVFSYDIVGTYT